MELLQCHACGQKGSVDVLDFGPQPICNRFLSSPSLPEALYPLGIWQCSHCGLVQVSHPAPAEDLRPTVDWLIYNEPEAHLDALLDYLEQLPGISHDSLVGAIVLGNDSTIARFEKRGFGRTWRIDFARDLGVSDINAGTETLQASLTPEAADRIVQAHGHFDLLVIRHVLEHAHQAHDFLTIVARLLNPGGYVVLEVPNCEPPLTDCDYTALWEEHIQYFTPATLRSTVELARYDVIDVQSPPPSLVAIARPSTSNQGLTVFAPLQLATEQQRYDRFAGSIAEMREKVDAYLKCLREKGTKVAFFGAGHLACAYINFLQVKDHLEFVVDDHPRKRGLFMPGSRLPIMGFSALTERGVKVCLSTLSTETEQKITSKNPGFFQNGGRFVSVIPGRANSLPV